ncbi:hypothetical protein [Streptomyces sp. NPDC046197]|uniref:hypothetical protein n=1 Tax=Streptomyces sp. NPDC046197 TaxID=3154337 RepID=UPI0033D58D77
MIAELADTHRMSRMNLQIMGVPVTDRQAQDTTDVTGHQLPGSDTPQTQQFLNRQTQPPSQHTDRPRRGKRSADLERRMDRRTPQPCLNGKIRLAQPRSLQPLDQQPAHLTARRAL